MTNDTRRQINSRQHKKEWLKWHHHLLTVIVYVIALWDFTRGKCFRVDKESVLVWGYGVYKLHMKV